MTESDWKRLLRQIRGGYVVPVLGSQLMAGSNGAFSIQRQVADSLLDQHHVPIDERPPMPEFRELNAAVSYLIGLGKKAQPLYVDVSDIFEALVADPATLPKPVRQLAEITDFRLFVTMTCDTLLAAALRGSRPVREIVHAPKLPTDEWQDLPGNWSAEQGNQAWVLYMFGKARPAPIYAIHDEDVLEYAHNIMARGSNVPVNFLKALQDRSLLLLGCGLPDWLGRFFLRLTNKDRLSEKTRHEWLVEASRSSLPNDELTAFLRHFSEDTECLQLQSPVAFIDELHQRWMSEQGEQGPSPVKQPTPARHGAVFFVSYSRTTDAARAQRLVEALRQLGCAEGEIWFDLNAIEPGEAFSREIISGIDACRYFLPLLSQATVRREEAYVFREWRAAQDRALSLNRDFIVPLVVDDAYEPNQYAGSVVRFDTLHFGHAPGGVPNEATLGRLKQLLRDARNPIRA
ncbi:TIR domain/SIR2-like domain (plasmid) [Paraburkholderia caribensis MBA4]|uniref:TIR domain/SIR2-like domain n=2 Tax=Paraburkholderia caribensis TaxID=75105 RepID=A0A0P0RLJ1_9BURK|nr:TIR domain/SIR2-like domain [Paraburkholderia caribensis MBA4]